MALRLNNPDYIAALPSLYLNVGKGFEDLGETHKAREHYILASSFTPFLPQDGYGKMIIAGIQTALARAEVELPGK